MIKLYHTIYKLHKLLNTNVIVNELLRRFLYKILLYNRRLDATFCLTDILKKKQYQSK